ncbi:hypothetical protein [Latilactobacillus sakei]|uniref:DUF3784 domain-containing protein n=1 Tax=Latilactobacillus sakei TaxID=1599 RepID=A0AAF0GUK1_LATSK|nr:hypothetical protein [Latilactobacillus sakei]WGI20112.1 hypothetical protein QBD03_05215 [Latilactobacillus sakei]
MTIFLTGIIFLFAILCIVLGIQFQRRRWLRLIAGNSFGDLPLEKSISVSQQTSWFMYLLGLFSLFICWWLNFSRNRMLLWIGIGIILLSCGVILIKAIKEWIKTGY